jgi:hypothetical protein
MGGAILTGNVAPLKNYMDLGELALVANKLLS